RHTRPTGAVRIQAKVVSVTYSDLCTHPCPYRLALLGTSLRMRGKLTLRKKAIIFYKSINCQVHKEQNREFKPSPLVGESGGEAVGRGKTENKRKTVFYGTSVNTCLSFLNGRKSSV
ncbi:MAG: hypothetical protein E6164_05065, partial [Dialister sp.]|nr:hypothetical protein [Dialister sp.]